MSTGIDRYLAFERHRRALKLDPDPDLVVFAAGFNEEEGYEKTETLACAQKEVSRRWSRPTTGWRSAPSPRCDGMDFDCPRDISVTGYNDMPLVDRLSPP